MGGMIKAILSEGAREQRGYVYILVLLFLVLGGLMIAPLLDFMGTGLGSGREVFEPKTDELYAADAGIDDAIWQIKYENISSPQSPVAGYNEYDYNTEWSYDLTDPVNDESVSVTIKNEWIPDIAGVDPSDPGFPALAEGIIDAGKLRVNGSATVASEYRIRIDYDRQEDEVLTVQSIGIWLPSGFSYVSGSSNLEGYPYEVVPAVEPYAGGETVIWSLGLEFGELPPADSSESAIIEFEYDSETERRLETISWIKTSGVDDIPFSWDDDMKVFTLTSSAAGGTTVESSIYMSGRYSSLLDNAITSPASIDTQPGTTVNGIIECPPGGFDPPDNGDWEHQDYSEDWPDTEEWRQFYLADVAGAPDPGSSVDVKNYDYDSPLGPWYRDGDLQIKNTGSITTVPLGGTIYVTGDLEFKQPGAPKAYTLDLNYNTIFVEGSITFPAHRVGITGSGCIIAIGDINFQPQMESNSGDFVFVCSLTGTVNFHPQGDFYGSVAGDVEVNMQPGTSITWTPPPGGLNLPGMGGSGTGGFGRSITKYTWKID